MKTYIVQYRINGGSLLHFDKVRAINPANAIAHAARNLGDIEGDLEIVATEQ